MPPSGTHEPSKIHADQLTTDWNFWLSRQKKGLKGLVFVSGLKKDMRESFVSHKGKGKARVKNYVEVDDEDDEDDVIVEDHLLAVASSNDAPQVGLAAFVDYNSEAPSSSPTTPNPSADNPPAKPNWNNPLRSGKPLRLRTLGSSLPLLSSPLSTVRPLQPFALKMSVGADFRPI